MSHAVCHQQPRRSKTPNRIEQKIDLPAQKPTSTASNAKSNPTTPVNTPCQSIQFTKKRKPDIPELNYNQMRQKCINSAMTAEHTHFNSNRNNQNDSSLKIALQLAEYHKRQSELLKLKINQLEESQQKLKYEMQCLLQQNKRLQQNKGRYEQKYKKVKQKYRQLKKIQTSHTNLKDNNHIKQINNIHNDEKQGQNIALNPSLQQKYLLTIDSLNEQLYIKTSTIAKLCEQIQQCEQNTVNILKVVNILQQKTQQLSMDNSLLKGILRQRQISQSNVSDAGENGVQSQLQHLQTHLAPKQYGKLNACVSTKDRIREQNVPYYGGILGKTLSMKTAVSTNLNDKAKNNQCSQDNFESTTRISDRTVLSSVVKNKTCPLRQIQKPTNSDQIDYQNRDPLYY